MKPNWVLICEVVALAFAVASCAVLEWREMMGVSLLLLAILAHEKAKLLGWIANEERRRVEEEARRLAAIAKMEADLKSRTPGQGRQQRKKS